MQFVPLKLRYYYVYFSLIKERQINVWIVLQCAIKYYSQEHTRKMKFMKVENNAVAAYIMNVLFG